MLNVLVNVKLKMIELKVFIIIIFFKLMLIILFCFENVLFNVVKMSGVVYINVCVMIEEIVVKFIRCFFFFDCFCLVLF